MTMTTGQRLALAAFVLMVLVAVAVRARGLAPSIVRAHGGALVPWTDSLDAERRTLAACVGVAMRERPRLYVLSDTAPELRIDDGYARGLYYPLEHAVVLRHDWTLPVLRHELVHATTRSAAHGALFDEAARCGFTPFP